MKQDLKVLENLLIIFEKEREKKDFDSNYYNFLDNKIRIIQEKINTQINGEN